MIQLAKASALGRGLRSAASRVKRSVRRLYRPRILLYTDSRGTNIPGHLDYKHYGARLDDQFAVDAFYCPEKWTTILDFWKLTRSISLKDYDVVILHAGIVDASPRHQQILLSKIYPEKRDIFDEVFGSKAMQDHLKGDLGCDYEGDKTNNMYSLQMAIDSLVPKLRTIPNLIWIGCNRVLTDWRGNYWKDRPKNIRIVEEYSKTFVARLPITVDLSSWTEEEVRLFTFDNIHLNQAGSDIVYERLCSLIGELRSKRS